MASTLDGQRIDRRTLAGTRLSAEQRHARAQKAGNALLEQYSLGYFAALGRYSAKMRRQREGEN